jgi:hypothetical protein
VAVDKDGFIDITHRAGGDNPKSPEDARDTIVVFDPEGKFVRSFGKEYHGGGHDIDIREEEPGTTEANGRLHGFGRYSAGIGWSGRSLSQKMVTTHHRLPS